MSWTGRRDDLACCGDDPGLVAHPERLARLLHSKIEAPLEAAFTRKDLTWHGASRPFENGCGFADGCSVDRRDSLDDDELRRRAWDRANAAPGREGRGAVVASASVLRGIAAVHDPSSRAVYIYDDPMAGNRQHAVIRVNSDVPRSDFDKIRVAIMAAFSDRVSP